MTLRAGREALIMLGELKPTASNLKGRTDYHARNKAILEGGRHPATGLRLCPDLGTCGDCVHHVVNRSAKTYHKCELHRLGTSRSEASDIRVSWPACSSFKASTDLQGDDA